jgi:hypothetical protein
MIKHFIHEYELYKKLGQRAMDQLSEEELNTITGSDNNSAAIIVRHISGNLVSRFTDFLTTDGEKSWRNRDEEFVEKHYSRAEIQEMWEKGWSTVLNQLNSLEDADLQKTVVIRNEPWNVHAALCRSVAHTSFHVGQIILIARMFRQQNWQWLTIPKKKPS